MVGGIMRIFIALCMLLAPVAAHAEWLEAASDHFVVYAEARETDARLFSQQLESYHAAMVAVTGVPNLRPSPSNRLTIYVVSNEAQVRRLYGANSQYIGGFYVPRAGGSVAIVPQVRVTRGQIDTSMITLLHEYAHHFLTGSSRFALPRWMSEGGAEFFSSAAFPSDGSVELGRPAQHRAYELYKAADVTAEDLLDPAAYEKRRGKRYDAFYGKSWLLYHYLTFSPERKGQLQRYLTLLSQGKDLRSAAAETFGDFEQLEHELDRYLLKSRMTMIKLPPSMIKTGPVVVQGMTAGANAMMPVIIRSRRGVNDEVAKAVLADARAIASRFPKDPTVLSALAEAEHDAGNDREAIAAADAALAVDPRQVNAYVQKGLSLYRIAQDAPGQGERYKQARAAFTALNRIENDHPLPLFYYYDSFVRQGTTPSALALQALERASELAPFDLGLRMTLAMQQLRVGDRKEARRNLLPVAYNPHGGSTAEFASKVLERMDKEPNWDGSGMPALVPDKIVEGES
jgi:tetratricopeptide (TPR) repeat protein